MWAFPNCHQQYDNLLKKLLWRTEGAADFKTLNQVLVKSPDEKGTGGLLCLWVAQDSFHTHQSQFGSVLWSGPRLSVWPFVSHQTAFRLSYSAENKAEEQNPQWKTGTASLMRFPGEINSSPLQPPFRDTCHSRLHVPHIQEKVDEVTCSRHTAELCYAPSFRGICWEEFT